MVGSNFKSFQGLSEGVGKLVSHCALLMGQILLLMPTGGRGGWSSDGCSVKEKRMNETICTCSHLTSFGILLVTYPYSVALDSGSEG